MIRLKRVYIESKEKLDKLKNLELQLSNYKSDTSVDQSLIDKSDSEEVVQESEQEKFDYISQTNSEEFARETRGPIALSNGKIYTG